MCLYLHLLCRTWQWDNIKNNADFWDKIKNNAHFNIFISLPSLSLARARSLSLLSLSSLSPVSLPSFSLTHSSTYTLI